MIVELLIVLYLQLVEMLFLFDSTGFPRVMPSIRQFEIGHNSSIQAYNKSSQLAIKAFSILKKERKSNCNPNCIKHLRRQVQHVLNTNLLITISIW